jgi:hypothetical protein
MYVGAANFSAVVAYIDGFNAALCGGPLLGFHQWLVVQANTGNNSHWAGLLRVLVPPPTGCDATKAEEHWIQAAGQLITEYLRYRDENGITKVYHDFAKWLLRKRWYRGPLRKKDGMPG